MLDVKNNNLILTRSFGNQDDRIISIAWHPKYPLFFTGDCHGVIHKYNTESGYCVLQFTDSRAIIWDLKVFDSFVISCDSVGKIQIWDAIYGTLHQTLKEHFRDILALALNADFDTLFSCGIDQKIVCIKRECNSNTWIKAYEVKNHTHDVRSLDLSSNGILISGGVDTQLVVLRTDNSKYAIKYDQMQDSYRFFSVSGGSNILAHQNDTYISLWQISNNVKEHALPVKFLNIKSKGIYHILSMSLSFYGTMIAISTVKSIWIYYLDFEKVKIQCIFFDKLPCYEMRFCSSDALILLATIKEGVQVMDIKSKVRKTFSLDFCHSPVKYLRCKDNLIVMRCSDNISYLYDYMNENLVCKLPNFNNYALYAFSSKSLLIYSSFMLYEYNVISHTLINCGQINIKEKQNYFKGIHIFEDDSLALYTSSSIYFVKRNNGISYQVLRTDKLVSFLSSFINGNVILVEQGQYNLPPILLKEQYGV